MKKQFLKQMKVLGTAFSMVCCLALAGCGGEKKEPEKEAVQTEEDTKMPADDLQDQSPEKTDVGENGSENEKQPEKNTGAAGAEHPEGTESLEGDVRELAEGRFTMVKAYTEEDGNGGSVMAVPAGDDVSEEFDLVEVSYGKETMFERQTIWDGGARYETEASSMEALEKGQSVKIRGTYGEDGVFAASQICIIEVVIE